VACRKAVYNVKDCRRIKVEKSDKNERGVKAEEEGAIKTGQAL